MTNIGRTVFTEYLSLVNEQVEDDKNKIRIDQGIYIIKRSLSVINLFLRCFVYMFIIWGIILIFASTDQSTLTLLREASDQAIIDGIKTFFSFVIVLTVVTLFVYFAIRVVFLGETFYFSLKQHRIEEEKCRARELEHVIDVSEELLRRHKLISTGINE